MNNAAEEQPARKRQPLAQRAYEMVKEDILMHRLLPREPLRESELATRYGLSKTPVREALLVLAREGIVEMSAFRGMRVRDFSAEDAREIYELKEVLEPLAVELSVPRMNEDDFIILRELLQQGWEAVETGNQDELSRLNEEFHQGLIAKCGNSRMLETLEYLQSQIRVMALRLWMFRATYTEEAQEHEGILEAASHGNASHAAKLLRQHYARFKERYVKELE